MKEKTIIILKSITTILVIFIFFYSLFVSLIRTHKKYEFSKNIILYTHPETNETVVLHRIISLKDFFNVKKGDFGGYIENQNNLSQFGTSWVYDNAKVFSGGMVLDNAKVYKNALIYDNATIMNRAVVTDNSKVHNNVTLGGNVLISGNTELYKADSYFMENQRIYFTPEYDVYFINDDKYRKNKEKKRKKVIQSNEMLEKMCNLKKEKNKTRGDSE